MNEERFKHMQELKVFEKEGFGSIRTVEIDGKPYFVASDVAKALGYTNTSKAIGDHCRWVTKRYIPHPQSETKTLEVNVIPKGDVVRLAASSELPTAEKFESWIFDEVIPSVLDNGGYIAGQETLSDDELLEKAILVAQRKIAERDKIIAQQRERIEEQQPLVDFAVHVSQSKDTIDMDEMAKIAKNENINIGRNRLIKWMKEKKILKDNRTPYQQFINRGYFDVVETKKETMYGTLVFPKTVITGKGQLWIIEKLRTEYFNIE